ncbi:NB-ARC domain-containing protein [Chamaesiphon polymorphus]|uniref:NB-ARC domain-containing protein n=1 Tax=Chamaesiphon polymorphus CCALA 037 TaxID=2107692 RepID=A0A2T1GBQ6_9CYAN|nr:NB-ARC domain-containing protein [Chamaesiphon polymorphus]PSB54779.1 hypothetical protein C7B77_17080 [Chamaesiphon polymorphus CCALA 037]
MNYVFPDPKRYRGFVLTSIGLQKVQQRIQSLELQTGVHQGARAIAERVQTIEPDGIHPITVRKILRGDRGVDKRSIERVFAALQLVLAVGDYTHAGLAKGKISADFDRAGVRRHVVSEDSNSIAQTDVTGLMKERSRLRHKILVDECRLMVVVGASGTGKTELVKQITAEVAPAFEYFVWQSLAPAPTIDIMLAGLLESLLDPLDENRQLPMTVAGSIACLLDRFQRYRCLLVLDGVESILTDRPVARDYRRGYEGYQEVFEAISTRSHLSCSILISRKQPSGFEYLDDRFVSIIQLP